MQECNDASLNFNRFGVFLLALYCVLSHDLCSVTRRNASDKKEWQIWNDQLRSHTTNRRLNKVLNYTTLFNFVACYTCKRFILKQSISVYHKCFLNWHIGNDTRNIEEMKRYKEIKSDFELENVKFGMGFASYRTCLEFENITIR